MVKTTHLTTKLSALALAIALTGCGSDLEPSAGDSDGPQFNAPAMTSDAAPTTVGVDEEYSHTFTATDADGDALTYSASLPDGSWLNFDTSTGVLSGTPASGDKGISSVTVSVTDGIFTTSETALISVGSGGKPETGGNLLTNSTFDAGISDWNAGTVVSVFPVPVAGNPWEVNLSHIMTLVPGEVYTLNYDAKASESRNLIAGFGLNHDPWTNVTETVDLTTEWQSFSYTEASAAGDDNSRTIFDMGAQAGDVSLRNIQLINEAGDDLVVGAATAGAEAANHYEALISNAGNPWDVSLSQVMTIIPEAVYVVEFKAKASVARNITVGVGLAHDPWTNTTESVAITTEWTPYFVVVPATGFGDDNSRVLFDMGDEVGDVLLDDIQVGIAQ